MIPRRVIFAALATVAVTFGATAQQPPAQPPSQGPGPGGAPPTQAAPAVFPGLPTVPLQPLLDRVARESHKSFIVDGKVGPDIFLGGLRAEDITYPTLLSLLRANGLASVEINGRVNVVRSAEIRFLPTPIVPGDDRDLAPDEWITRVVTVKNVSSGNLVPILRPLMPVAAHLAALPPNHLIIMDQYANVKRIAAIVKALDQPGAGAVPGD
jgi:general secretion pathway protein D